MARSLRDDAFNIWHAGVEAVRPEPLTESAVGAFRSEVRSAPRILVVGTGKAGAGMALGLERGLAEDLDRVEGIVNVPEGSTAPLQRIRLHPARPAGSNHPTEAGVAGADDMLRLLASAGPSDVAFCLISGGGSALLPAPVEGITLTDKQAVTKLLHACGATIGEMNAVRKHLSRVKGGRLAQAFRGKRLISLIISDVVGDPLDVIGSGPTAADPSTFTESLAVLDRYQLRAKSPATVVRHLELGAAGEIPETPKVMPEIVENRVIGSNGVALAASEKVARSLGYNVLNLGSFIEGETKPVAEAFAGMVRGIRSSDTSLSPPACILFGGETTVSLGDNPGRGGRNQEFALAALTKLGAEGMKGVAILSGGTDGEDGPTDAAGAVADESTWPKATDNGLSPEDFLQRHDAYPFFDCVDGLIRTGLTGTNVMDVRVILVR